MSKEPIFLKRDSITAQIGISENLSACSLSNMHFHEALELLYITRGAIKCDLASAELILRPGDILFLNSNVPHKTESIENGTDCALFQFQNLSLSDSHLKHLAEFLNLTGESVFVFRSGDPDYDEIQQHLTAIARASASKGAAYEFYIASGIYAVLAVLHRKKLLSSAQELVNPELLKKILPVFPYIDENYSEHLSLEDLARCVNFHKAYFCRLFKQATGITVVDYLNFVRIREAEALLRSNMSAIEASYLVGFSSPSYFTKIFKKYRLCSPSTYKKIYSRADKMFADRVIGQ